MKEKNDEHQRQIEEQKANFLAKQQESQSQKTQKMKIDELTKEIRPKIDEANETAKQLDQKVTFSFGIIGGQSNDLNINLNLSSFAVSEKKYDIEIKVNNLDTDEVYVWTRTKFHDRLMEMRDLLATYE